MTQWVTFGGIYLKKPETLIFKKFLLLFNYSCMPFLLIPPPWNVNLKEHNLYVDCSVIYNFQDLEIDLMSVSKRVGKTSMGHLHNGTLLSYKKRKFKDLPFATSWRDPRNIMLSEISQSEKYKYHMILVICGI